MLALNIVLVIVGVVIPIGTAVFWSIVKKIVVGKFDNKLHNGIILNKNITCDLAQ